MWALLGDPNGSKSEHKGKWNYVMTAWRMEGVPTNEVLDGMKDLDYNTAAEQLGDAPVEQVIVLEEDMPGPAPKRRRP